MRTVDFHAYSNDSQSASSISGMPTKALNFGHAVTSRIVFIKSIAVVISIAAVLFLFLFPEDAFARAGGGSAKGGGWFYIFAAPFLIIYSMVITYYAGKRNKQCKELLEKISSTGPFWEHQAIKERIGQVYFKVQEAWAERNQDIAKAYMSDRLYNKHKMQTDSMIKNRHKNVLEAINLKDATVVEVMDYKDDSKDTFWVLIHGSMVDYTIDEKTSAIINGEKKNNSFKELWRFKRESHGWVLDEIDQDVSISDLSNFKPFSEEVH